MVKVQSGVKGWPEIEVEPVKKGESTAIYQRSVDGMDEIYCKNRYLADLINAVIKVSGIKFKLVKA